MKVCDASVGISAAELGGIRDSSRHLPLTLVYLDLE